MIGPKKTILVLAMLASLALSVASSGAKSMQVGPHDARTIAAVRQGFSDVTDAARSVSACNVCTQAILTLQAACLRAQRALNAVKVSDTLRVHRGGTAAFEAFRHYEFFAAALGEGANAPTQVEHDQDTAQARVELGIARRYARLASKLLGIKHYP